MDEIIAFLKKRIDVLNPEAMAEDLSLAVAMYYTASTYFAKKEAVYTMNLAKAIDAVKNAPGSQKRKSSAQRVQLQKIDTKCLLLKVFWMH